ncbi:DNA replication protein [Serratia plymuthica]|uniref:DNA replication protein n=1 Tax=Serratia plymuthica TaxID=82996 RepID=UPI001928D26F|nr:DNA replication protein [Serratia plymuthica]MBL3522839.1 DNA replication protein [Serratia plymuthica]
MSVVRKLSDYRPQEQPVETPEATGKGFALIHRQFMDSRLYKDSQAVHLWLHLILKANYSPAVVKTDIGEMMVGRGQMITGRPTLVSETFIPDNKVKSLLRSFESKGMLKIEAMGRKFSLITILKYDDFQARNCPTNVQQLSNANSSNGGSLSDVCPTNVQQLSINNNITNNSLSNDKEMSSADDQPAKKKSVQIPYQEIMDTYNEVAGDRLPNAEKLNPKRKRDIKRLLSELKEPSVDAAKNYFQAFIGSAGGFYFGDNDRGWRASFDYLLRSETLVKTREGTL